MRYLLILGTIFVVIILYFFDFGFLKGQITEYTLICERENYIDYQCTERWLPLNPTTYKPNSKTQTVLYSTLGSWYTLTDCSVANRKNWTCTYDDGSGAFGFDKGQFWSASLQEDSLGSRTPFDDIAEYRYVPKYIYRLEEMKWW